MGTLTPYGGIAPGGALAGVANVPGGLFLVRGGFFGPTEPAGKPSLRGLPTGRFTLGSAFGSTGFLPLPLGLPGRRLAGVSGDCATTG